MPMSPLSGSQVQNSATVAHSPSANIQNQSDNAVYKGRSVVQAAPQSALPDSSHSLSPTPLAKYSVTVSEPSNSAIISPEFWLDSLVEFAAAKHDQLGLATTDEFDELLDAEGEITMMDFDDDEEFTAPVAKPPAKKQVHFAEQPIQQNDSIQATKAEQQPNTAQEYLETLRSDYASATELLAEPELAQAVKDNPALTEALNSYMQEELAGSLSQQLIGDLYNASQSRENPKQRFQELCEKLSQPQLLTNMLVNNYLTTDSKESELIGQWLSIIGESLTEVDGSVGDSAQITALVDYIADDLKEIPYDMAQTIAKLQ